MRLSDVPAQLMGLRAGLEVGQPATFCVLQVTPESWLETLEVYVDGKAIAQQTGTPPCFPN